MSTLPKSEQESEASAVKPRKLATELQKHRQLVKPVEGLFIVVFVVIVVVLLKILVGDLSIKHEVNQATATSDKAVSAMAKQNMAALRALGDKKFQADHTATELSGDLTFKTTPPITFAQLYGKTKPTVDQRIVANNSRGQHVAVVYRYDTLKVPLYVRIDTEKLPGSSQWHIQALSVNPDESVLLGNGS